MIYHCTSAKEILSEELRKRKLVNPRYSMRAFSRDIKLSPSKTSEVLSGKMKLSSKRAVLISDSLNHNQDEQNYFVNLVLKDNAKSLQQSEGANKAIEMLRHKYIFNNLNQDTFRIISDWYHYAILELCYLEDFESSLDYVCKKLSISKFEAEEAMKRLEALSLLDRTQIPWKATEDFTASPYGFPSEALKNFHTQVIKKAQEALWTESVDNRSVTSTTFAFSHDCMAEAQEMIRQFRREFTLKFQNSAHKDRVYNLAIQLFPLSK